jgi:phospholipase A-2-activating protein
LDVDPAGKFIVSGAWDQEARIWPVGKWESDVVLKGHDGAVWAVLAYDSDTIVTACADQKIRIFHKSGKLLKGIQASNHPVRALCRVQGHPSGADFASGDNDGTIKLWLISGKQVGELHGHESFIYSLASLPTGEIISSGEDRTVRIWKGNQCIQTITLPAISVWCVAACAENGDIVAGASDKMVRVFTKSTERFADAETTRQFEDSVKESSIPQQTMGDINKEKLPGPEFLTQKAGTKDGQVQMIKEANGSVTAHTWSSAANQWINVGTVVDSVGSSGKKVDYQGKEYDYVFDVDIEDGKPALKLPYNLSQNPYEAATKFIHTNELPITYLDQVANFITQNTKGTTIGSSAPAPAGADPWGSENRYRPDEQPAAVAPPKVLPQKEYLSIVTARVPQAQKKILELNSGLISGGHKDLSLNPTEVTVLNDLCKFLESSSVATAKTPVGGLDLIIKLCTLWPYEHRLPGLDLLRLLIVSPASATWQNSRSLNIVDVLIAGSTEESPPKENHVMMALRGFANLFSSSPGRDLAFKEFSKIEALLSSTAVNSTNRNVLVAAATVYINFAVLFTSDGGNGASDAEQPKVVLETATQMLGTMTDSEAVYRMLVAVGTLAAGGVKTAEIGKAVKAATGKVGEPRVKRVVGEVEALLR